MLTQRTIVPPGFTELAGDAELARQLGTVLFGALIRLCHLAAPSADVPGGWCTTLSADDLAAELGVTRKTAAKWLSDLQAAGLIARVEGKRLGRGLGATPNRYFITAIAGLTRPTPSPVIPGTSSRGKVSPGNSAHVIAYPAHPRPVLVQASSIGDEVPDPVVDVSSLHTQHPDEAPRWLADALRSIGYIGPLPTGTLQTTGPETVLRVIEEIRTRSGIDSPARYLNWLLRSGGTAIEDFLADAPADSTPPAAMDVDEYLSLREAFPAWHDHVQACAQQMAAEAGGRVDLRVILQAAALIDVADFGLRAQPRAQEGR